MLQATDLKGEQVITATPYYQKVRLKEDEVRLLVGFKWLPGGDHGALLVLHAGADATVGAPFGVF